MAHEETITTATSIVNLIDYQDGSIVSRSLLKHQAGSVTVFAFDRGQELSEHTVPHDALVQLLDGAAEIKIAGTPHRLGQGDLILMPGGQPHAVKAVDRFKMVLTMLKS